MMTTPLALHVPAEDDGMRLVTWLIRRIRTLSRPQIQRLIHERQIHIGGQAARDNQTLQAGDLIAFMLPPPRPPTLQPQAIPLEILHEDADILVVDKPAGLLMHPARGHRDGTLANALIQRCPDLIINNETRPGLVHRLDRDTSGVLVVAKNARALTLLARQFKSRTIIKEYRALVIGQPDPSEGVLDGCIGPDPHDPHRLAVVPPGSGKPATTHYAVLETKGRYALLRVIPETGRRHQIRVHLAACGHPIIGDRVYGGTAGIDHPPSRQLLHAYRIRFRHPATNTACEFTAPVPADFDFEL